MICKVKGSKKQVQGFVTAATKVLTLQKCAEFEKNSSHSAINMAK